MIGREDDQSVFHPAGLLQYPEHPAQMIIELLDQPHVDGPYDVEHVVAMESAAIHVIGESLVDGVSVIEFLGAAHDRNAILDAVHVVVGRRRDIGPVRLDVAEVQEPRVVALLAG